MTDYKVKRVYEHPSEGDGCRILVDRIWPRGVSKEEAQLAAWYREVAPSTELRQWFGHKPERFAEFRSRYMSELGKSSAVGELVAFAKHADVVTLLYGARDTQFNQAVVLKEFLQK